MNNLKISQSLLKRFRSFEAGYLCGKVLEARDINKEWKTPPSEAQAKGQYFEFLATGQAPVHGDPVPEPRRYLKDQYSKKTNEQNWKGGYKKGSIHPDWAWPVIQAKKFKEYCQHYEIEIISAGKKHTLGDVQGTTDLIVWLPEDRWIEFFGPDFQSWKETEGRAILDLKFSDLIGDKRNRLGWHTETLSEYHGLQASVYRILTGLPFAYWCFGSKDFDSRIYPVAFNEFCIEQIKEELKTARARMIAEMRSGFGTNPGFRYCPSCKVQDCPDRLTVPVPAQISHIGY